MKRESIFGPDAVDVTAYLAEQEAGKIHPASHWLDADALAEPKGYAYPKSWDLDKGRFTMRKGEGTLWTGHGKGGKTTGVSQVSLCAMRQGARVGVISLEWPPRRLVPIMRWQSFGMTRGLLSEQDVDTWREWVDDRLWLYDHVGTRDALRIAAAAWHMAKNLRCDVITVDSLMMCGVRMDGDGFASAQTEFLNRLLAIARDLDVHIHLVAHARKTDKSEDRPPRLGDVSGSANLVNLPHAVVSLWRNPAITRTEDAVLSILADRTNGYMGATRLWFHDTARQFVGDREALPERYVR